MSSNAASVSSQDLRRVWVYFPQGLLTSHTDLQLEPSEEARYPTFHECQPGHSNPMCPQQKAAVDAGHSVFQDSFFVCAVKDMSDLAHTKDIYLETVVDANCGLGFAKVYPSRSTINAIDILQDRVLPFYRRHGETIGNVFTRCTRQYCGVAAIHPFETLLATSHIQHRSLDPRNGAHGRPCDEFYSALSKEFFAPAIRRYSEISLTELQRDLDTFVEIYNHARPCFQSSAGALTPFAKFSDRNDHCTDSIQAPAGGRS
jgi:hypothetical protein